MITQEELKDVLNYDPTTGLFKWRRSVNSRSVVGSTAGSRHGQGYILVKLRGRGYLAHRLAFLWMEGALPSLDVDHINGVRDDNRWSNLRQVSKSVNQRNRHAAQRNSKTGFLGVRRRGSRYYAQHAQKHLGAFATAEEAFAAYREALCVSA